jgi:hypothetical protein
MENVIQKELEREESELTSSTNQSSWKRYIGFQRSTIEEKHRQQCVKELERVLISRRQLNQSMKSNQVVGKFMFKILRFEIICLASFDFGSR